MNKAFILKIACCAFLLAGFINNALAQSDITRPDILSNSSLVAEIENYELYIKQLSAKYKIGDHVITLTHNRIEGQDTYRISMIAYRTSVMQFKPSFYLIINDLPVLVQDDLQSQPANNKDVAKYISDNYLKDDLDSGIVPDSSLYRYPQFANEHQPDSILVNGHKEKVKIEHIDSGRIKQTDIIPKTRWLTYKKGVLINKTESKWEFMVQN